MKRILFVGNTSWSMYNFRLGIFKMLREKGFEILVSAPVDDTTDLIRQEGFAFYPMVIDNKGTSIVNDAKLLIDYFKLYKSLKPDLIFHYTMKPNIYGTMAAKLAATPSISVVTGAGYSFMSKNWLSYLVKQLLRVSFSFARRVWFLNHDDLDFFSGLGIVKREKVDILPGEGIDTDYFNTVDTGSGKQEFTFLFLGRLLWDKGVGEYVEASRILKSQNRQITCAVLGFLDVANPSAIPSETVSQWQEEGLIQYLGSTSDVKTFILGADCVVLPSYREGIPRSLMEAASLKRPVIATDTVGCRDVVEDGVTGYLVQVKDSQGLAVKMDQMLSLPYPQRQDMGDRGRQKMIREFDQTIVIGTYLKILNSLT